MHYLIYIPGKVGYDDAHLRQVGLADLCRGQGADWFDAASGPDGASGMCATWRRTDKGLQPPTSLSGLPDTFRWESSPAFPSKQIPRSAFYVGWDTAHPPGPADLARPTLYDGQAIALGDNNQWRIPAAWHAPTTFTIDPDTGEPYWRTSPEFHSYCNRACQYAMLFYEREEMIGILVKLNAGHKLTPSEEAVFLEYTERVTGERHLHATDVPLDEIVIDVSFENPVEHALQALAFNYRLNGFLVSLFGLFTSQDVVRDICMASIEAMPVARAVKKNMPGSPITIPVGLLI